MKKTAYFLIFNRYADWEPSYAMVGLHLFSDYQVKTISFDKHTVTSMGGLSVRPDLTLDEFDIDDAALLVLPGAYQVWELGGNEQILPIVDQMIRRQIPVAAICAGTTFLARHGYLEGVKHTSNAKVYFDTVVPGYAGAELYDEHKFVVNDRNIITGSGLATLEFANEIFRELGVVGTSEFEEWFQYFRLRLQEGFPADMVQEGVKSE